MDGRLELDVLKKVRQKCRKELHLFKLSDVAKHFLNTTKEMLSAEKITNLFKGNAAEQKQLYEYCLKDAYLCQKLIEKLKLLEEENLFRIDDTQTCELYFETKKGRVEIEYGDTIAVDNKIGQILYVLCEEITVEEFHQGKHSIKILDKDRKEQPLMIQKQTHLGYCLEYQILLKSRGVFQVVVESETQTMTSVWFIAGSYHAKMRKEYRILKRVKTIKRSINIINNEDLKKKLKELSASYSRLRFWASLAANAIILHNLENDLPLPLTETFFLHILKDLSGRKKKETAESQKWKEMIEALELPTIPECQYIEVIKDLAHQMYANFHVHIQRLKERLAYNLKHCKGIWFSNNLAENILNAEVPTLNQV